MVDDGHHHSPQSPESQKKFSWDELRARSLTPGGFGEARVDIWPWLLGAASDIAQSSSNEYITDVGAEKPHPDEYQIGLDTDRSFILYPDLECRRDRLQRDLRMLLVSLFRKRPKLNYFQGYHDIVTVLYLTLPPQSRFACVEKMSLQRLRDSMGLTLEPLLGLLRVTRNLLRLYDDDYSDTLERSSSMPFHALPHILTLLSHDMPTLPLIQHVFDYLLCRPPIVIVYLVATIIIARKHEVERLQDEDGMLHSLLSSLPIIRDDLVTNEIAEGFLPLRDRKRQAEFFDLGTPPTDNGPEICTPHSSSNDAREETPIQEHARDLPRSVDEKSNCSHASLLLNRSSMDHIPTDSSVAMGSHVESEDPHEPQDDDQCFHDTPVSTSIGIGTVCPIQDDFSGLVQPSETVSSQPSLSDHQSSSDGSLSNPTPSDVLLLQSDSDVEKHIERTSPRSRLPTILLTTLLADADSLYAKFPPTHPSLSLSAIMGPQSVVFTWSESQVDLPTDDSAEAMVTVPELVVYQYIEETLPEKVEDSKAREKRQWRNLRKARMREKRTLLIGGLLVLGVALAMHGMRSRSWWSIQGTAGIYKHLQSRDWIKLGKWLSRILEAVGTRVKDGWTI